LHGREELQQISQGEESLRRLKQRARIARMAMFLVSEPALHIRLPVAHRPAHFHMGRSDAGGAPVGQSRWSPAQQGSSLGWLQQWEQTLFP
jgi:hypothetical protein